MSQGKLGLNDTLFETMRPQWDFLGCSGKSIPGQLRRFARVVRLSAASCAEPRVPLKRDCHRAPTVFDAAGREPVSLYIPEALRVSCPKSEAPRSETALAG